MLGDEKLFRTYADYIYIMFMYELKYNISVCGGGRSGGGFVGLRGGYGRPLPRVRRLVYHCID